MAKGKWFLQYEYDGKDYDTGNPHFHWDPTETTQVSLGKGIRSNKEALSRALKKWKEVLAHKPSKTDTQLGFVKKNPRNPCVIFEITPTDFPSAPKPPKRRRNRWL
jgi:hypothetical protein